jgi:hypothetical protein
MIDEVLRLATLAASVMASTTFMLALVIAAGGTFERAGARCAGCSDMPSIRALAKPPERGPWLHTAALQMPARR